MLEKPPTVVADRPPAAEATTTRSRKIPIHSAAAPIDLTTVGLWCSTKKPDPMTTIASIRSEKPDLVSCDLARSSRSMVSQILTATTLGFEEADRFDGPAIVDLAKNSRFTVSWIAAVVGFKVSDYRYRSTAAWMMMAAAGFKRREHW